MEGGEQARTPTCGARARGRRPACVDWTRLPRASRAPYHTSSPCLRRTRTHARRLAPTCSRSHLRVRATRTLPHLRLPVRPKCLLPRSYQSWLLPVRRSLCPANRPRAKAASLSPLTDYFHETAHGTDFGPIAPPRPGRPTSAHIQSRHATTVIPCREPRAAAPSSHLRPQILAHLRCTITLLAVNAYSAPKTGGVYPC